MAVPKKRTAKSKRNMRRSHHGLSRMHLSSCQRCHQPLPSHTVCANCGTYKGRAVIDVMAKLEKKAKREKKKELEQQEADHEH